jgi:ABC-type amino acid transport substrate-binding protein
MVRADGAPGMYEDENGELKGFYVELEKAIMEKMGQKYRLHGYYDVGVTVQKIRDGIAHSALSVPDLPDYRTFLRLSIPYEDLNFVTNVQASNAEINATTKDEIIKQLFGKKVGVQTRGHIYQSLRDYKEIELIEYATTTQALAALDKGELDAVPDVKRIAMFYSNKNNWKIKSVGEPILTQKITTGFSQAIDPSVVDRYNVALQSLLDSGYVDKLYNSYFGHLEQ